MSEEDFDSQPGADEFDSQPGDEGSPVVGDVLTHDQMVRRIYEMTLHGGSAQPALQLNSTTKKMAKMNLRIFNAQRGGLLGSKTDATYAGWWCVKQLRKIAPVSVALVEHIMTKASPMVCSPFMLVLSYFSTQSSIIIFIHLLSFPDSSVSAARSLTKHWLVQLPRTRILGIHAR